MNVKESTRPIIKVIEERYEIPQLGRKRRISALLPADYYQSDKTYPVLYLNDGQNLYDENAPFGSWGIDRALETLDKEGYGDIIVIAIDHGGEDRITEYLPYFDTKFGNGEGQLYLKFIVDTLIPYVNKHYRTSQFREDTGIGGSSMGGLISLYAGLNYQETFGKMMVFSPSLWIAPKIFQQAFNYKAGLSTKMYLFAGGKESDVLVPNVLRFSQALLDNMAGSEKFKFNLSLNSEGEHNEASWQQEFPRALQWLYFTP